MKLRNHFLAKLAAFSGTARPRWFLADYGSMEKALEAFNAETENKNWVATFAKDKRPSLALAKLQREIAEIAVIRKAVADQFIAGGTEDLGELDSYRYAYIRNLLLTKETTE